MTPVSESCAYGERAFSRACSLALAGKQARYPSLHRMLSGFSCDEFLVGKALARCGDDEIIQPRQCGDFHVSVIQAERKLVDVAVKVLRAYLMVDTVNAALHDGPNALYAVRGHVAAHVFSGAMVDAGAVEEQPVKAVVGRSVVRVQGRASFDISVNGAVQRSRINVLDMHGDGAPATLTHSEDGGFSHGTTTTVKPLAGVFVRFLAADVGFVYFNDSAQGFDLFAASLSESLQDEPRRLLRD